MTAPKLYQRIAEAITQAIAAGRYAPGARLPAERDLAEEFAVSRPTIREAMIALEIRGLIEARHGSGIYVSRVPIGEPVTPELDVGAFELMEARILFEGEAAALAATTGDSKAIEKLERLLDQMAEHADDVPAAVDADRQFHIQIAEMTGNSLVRAAIETLWHIRERSPLCRHMFEQARREGVNPRVEEHRLIVDALRDGNSEAARTAMRAHLRRVIDDLLAATEFDQIERARIEAEARRRRITERTAI